MAYNYITAHNAKSFTSGRQGKSWDGTVVIHWWGDPRQNPTAEGVVRYFETSAPTSAHYVVTGTGRKVYHLVNNWDTAYHAGNWDVNLRSIGIECDPRCRDEDYDVLAELLANIWKDTGREPILIRHRDVVATACPGNYDIDRIDREMKAKYQALKNPAPAPKVEPPKPATKPVPAAVKLPNPIQMRVKINEANLWDLATNPNYVSKGKFKQGSPIVAFAKIEFNGSVYYQTQFSFEKGLKTAFNAADLEEIPAPRPVEKPVENHIPNVMKMVEAPVEHRNGKNVADGYNLSQGVEIPPKAEVETRVEVHKNDKIDMSHNVKITSKPDLTAERRKAMSEIHKIQTQAGEVAKAVEFSPVISEKVKSRTYFTTGGLLIATTLMASVSMALVPTHAVLILAIAGALNTAYAQVNQLFKISSKK